MAFEPSNVLVVDHLVSEVNPVELLRKRSGESATQSSSRAADLAFRRYAFDWSVAHREIVAAKATLQATDSWILLDKRLGGDELSESPDGTESVL